MSGLLDKQWQFAAMFGDFLVWLHSQGYRCRFGDAWRSTDKLKVPNCDTEYSYQELLFYNKKTKLTYGKHNDRVAVDLIIHKMGSTESLKSEEYRPLGEKWEEMGGRWGGRFGVVKEEYDVKIGWDANHFEL
jgi:hypothetical protein